jgi:hypothetical protein
MRAHLLPFRGTHLCRFLGDCGAMVQVLREKNQLVRGLTHPGAFVDPAGFVTAAAKSVVSSATPQSATHELRSGPAQLVRGLRQHGALCLRAQALYKLLSNGENVLLQAVHKRCGSACGACSALSCWSASHDWSVQLP